MCAFRKFEELKKAAGLILVCLGLGACSVLTPSAAPTTPFLTHGDQMTTTERVPLDAVWSSDPGHVAVESAAQRKMYVAPINTQYLNQKKNKQGEWVGDAGVSADDVKAITDQLQQNIIDEFRNYKGSTIQVVDQPGPDVDTLAVALVELVPTTVSVNVLSDVGGVVLPGSRAIEQAAAVGAQAATGSISSGSIAIEVKFLDATGKSLAEAKDRETDPASIIPNYRDFEQFGWSRETCRQWAREIAQTFNTTVDQKVEGISHFSILPW